RMKPLEIRQHMPSQRFPRLGASFLFAVFILACSSASAGNKTTLRIWAMGREGEVLSQLIPGFEKEHPDIHVEVQQIPWTAAHEKLLTAYVGEATPDIAMLGNTWVPEFVALNSLAPLDSFVAPSKEIRRDDFFPGIWKTNVVNGKTYGIPWYVDTRLIFYRTDLLAKAGYKTFPTTWADWVTAMKKMKSQMSARQFPMLMPTNEWPQPVGFALETGSPILRDGGRYGAFEEPAFRKAFDFYLSFYRQGFASPVSSTQVSNLFQEFERGNIAMYISGPWYIGEFKNRLDSAVQNKWSTAPMPGINGPGVSMAGGSSLSLFAGSQHKAEAWKLMEYLSRPSLELEFYKLTGDLPPRKTAWQDSALANNKYARAFRDQLERVVPLPQVPEWEEIATTIFEHGEQAIRKAKTVDQTLASLDQDVNAMLEKRRYLLAQAAPKK
ncbi:MAG TPA: sugar ABC transporter substrate-binding protein, partial [Gemmatimonadaceae bacterium]|nr:sugar ABC transporter substrate-binding protein [Gemmatimonadaceae bacterium]